VLILKLAENGHNATLSENPETAADANSNPINGNKINAILIV
jgi:hypothetical protein